jgi:hypothetical protein
MQITAAFWDVMPRRAVPAQETVICIMKARNFTSSANIIIVSKKKEK